MKFWLFQLNFLIEIVHCRYTISFRISYGISITKNNQCTINDFEAKYKNHWVKNQSKSNKRSEYFNLFSKEMKWYTILASWMIRFICFPFTLKWFHVEISWKKNNYLSIDIMRIHANIWTNMNTWHWIEFVCVCCLCCVFVCVRIFWAMEYLL